MPSTATHAYFIMDIYDKLPIERKIFLKDDVIKDVTSSMISEINSNLNSRYLASLDGMTAYEAFNLAYGEEILKALNVNYVESNNVRILNYKSYASIQT